MLRSETTIQSAEKINHFNYSTTVRILYCFRSRVFATGNYIVTTTEWSQVSSSTFWWTMPHVCGCGVVEGRCCTCTAKIQFNQWHTFSNFLILCVCVCLVCERFYSCRVAREAYRCHRDMNNDNNVFDVFLRKVNWFHDEKVESLSGFSPPVDIVIYLLLRYSATPASAF